MSFINKNPYFPDLISDELKKHNLREIDENSPTKKIFYCDISYGNRNNPNFHRCEIVNQLENVDPLGNKKDQYDITLQYYKKRPSYLPFTLSFDHDTLDKVKDLFLSNPRESPRVYIIKPENALSRRGVGIVRNNLELMSHLDKYSQYKEWIIQDYIDNPLLFRNKKFHFRIYVIYVQTEKYQVAYLGRKGFIYTANQEFQVGSFDENVVLSGENSKNNVFYVPDDFVREFGKNVWENKIWPQIKKITRETLKSALDVLKCPRKVDQKCFKILGYDILINEGRECFLAEINARNVSYKYPSKEFKDSFYKEILKLVLSGEPLSSKELTEKNIPYERILYKREGEILEGFNGYRVGDEGCKRRYFFYIVFVPFIILVLLALFFQLLIRK